MITLTRLTGTSSTSILIVLMMLMFTDDALAESEQNDSGHMSDSFLGATIGLPALVGLSFEEDIGNRTTIGLNTGTTIIANSLGCRLIFGRNDPGWNFRYYVGAAILHKWRYEVEYDGTSMHGWAGVRVALNDQDWRLVLEVGSLLGGKSDKGLGYSGITPAWRVCLMHLI
ncbi:MAG: hypothetical protein GF388_09605 [Candidatus Aegiribacteria sp.]|nr:hypothetical protein [Candidatus Aegiribacteria sp.]